MQDNTLIVEDVLLLMLDDKYGIPAGAGTLHQTLGGAVLVELALLGRIQPEGSSAWYKGTKVVAVGDGALPDPLLQSSYDTIAARPRQVQTLLVTIGSGLWKPVTERLVQRGLLRRERTRFLGLFPTTSLPAADTGHEPALREQMRSALEHGESPDARLAAITALISASGTLPSLDPVPKWSSAVATRAKELEQGNWGAAAVNSAVTRIAASFSAASAAAVVTTLS
ncbi:GPP34 family phosphoprotein [Saccharopolyspora erythraea]|uniref:GOLPH3/VPS74 family protein n=1 Tax=Saccharopolyspora erythraea TaxID=1836 RepID=UPI001BA48082|nr:GPP34 family phosphoprotein [Saccharopolyspora erythraea]QUH02019.1 GPP34 family phosphoprotein [Saccharopolyspora erythraea]